MSIYTLKCSFDGSIETIATMRYVGNSVFITIAGEEEVLMTRNLNATTKENNCMIAMQYCSKWGSKPHTNELGSLKLDVLTRMYNYCPVHEREGLTLMGSLYLAHDLSIEDGRCASTRHTVWKK
jgi:hypothetical protein